MSITVTVTLYVNDFDIILNLCMEGTVYHNSDEDEACCLMNFRKLNLERKKKFPFLVRTNINIYKQLTCIFKSILSIYGPFSVVCEQGQYQNAYRKTAFSDAPCSQSLIDLLGFDTESYGTKHLLENVEYAFQRRVKKSLKRRVMVFILKMGVNQVVSGFRGELHSYIYII